MTVKQLMEFLETVPPEATVIIHRDNLNYGYGHVERISAGLYSDTEYGGDFFPHQKLIITPNEIAAICIYPKDYEAENG